MDSWQQREMQRDLAEALNRTHERFRVASMKLRDATRMASRELDYMGSDSKLLALEAHQECSAAYAAYLDALERWKHFVMYGKLPKTKSPLAVSENP